MRVYHFTHGNHGLEDIRCRRLKIARISELNDPFEFLQVASRSSKTRTRYQYLKRALSAYMGLLCFSADWHNPVQWSHYADRHRGICLGFDVNSSSISKVSYVNERIKPNLRAMKEMGPAAVAHMLDLLTLKFRHWEYEEEYRLFVRLEDKDEETGLYFYDFETSKDVKLREVIVGPLSSVSSEQIAGALGDLAPVVRVTKARLAFRTFDVVEHKSRVTWGRHVPRVGRRDPEFEHLVDQTLQREDLGVSDGVIERRNRRKTSRRKSKIPGRSKMISDR